MSAISSSPVTSPASGRETANTTEPPASAEPVIQSEEKTVLDAEKSDQADEKADSLEVAYSSAAEYVPSNESATQRVSQSADNIAPEKSDNRSSNLNSKNASEEVTRSLENRVDASAKNPDNFISLKLLVSHLVAGGIIGRNGQEITSLQAAYDIRIKLSAARQYFPGTRERVVLLTGQSFLVFDAFNAILQRVREEAAQETGDTRKNKPNDLAQQMNLKIIVPKPAVGMIIGKSGSQVRELQDSSGCKICIMKSTQEMSNMKERVCLLRGTESQVFKATKMILEVLQGSKNLSIEETVSYPDFESLSGISASPEDYIRQMIPNVLQVPPYGRNIANLALNLLRNPEISTFNTGIDVQIPAMYAGTVIGSNGRTVNQIQSATNTNIQMSPKDHNNAADGNRTISISGPLFGILEALTTIVEKLVYTQSGYVKHDGSVQLDSQKFLRNTANKMVYNAMRPIMSNDYPAFPYGTEYVLAPNLQYHRQAVPTIRNEYPQAISGLMGGTYANPVDPVIMQQHGEYVPDFLRSQGVPFWGVQ